MSSLPNPGHDPTSTSIIWSSSVRSILKGWLELTAGAAPLYGERVLRSSSAVTMGASFDGAAPEDEVQGSKSYMEVSMSAKRMSSRARSVRKPEDEADREVLMSRLLGGRVSGALGTAERSSASGTSPSSFGLQGLLQSLESKAPEFKLGGHNWIWRGEGEVAPGADAAVGKGEGQSSSISSRAEEKLSLATDEQSLDVGAGGVSGEGDVQRETLSSSKREAGVRQASRGAGFDRPDEGDVRTGAERAGDWEMGGATMDNTLKAGCGSRKLSSTGSSGGGEGGKKSGRRLPSCFSSSWMRLSMLFISTRFSKLGSVTARWLYSFIRDMLKIVCLCRV